MMQAAGIKIIYSIPGLKVHAKVALVRRRGLNGEKIPSYAYISTGNFNEKTATLYADCGLFTCRKEIVNDLTTSSAPCKARKIRNSPLSSSPASTSYRN